MRYLLPLLLLAGCAPAPVFQASVPTPSAMPSTAGADPVPPGRFLFFEDFENGTDKWDVPATGWKQLAAFSCGGKYTMLLPDTGQPGESYLTLEAPIDLSKAVKPVLKYDVKGLTSPAEAVSLTVEVRPTGQDWRPVGHSSQGDHVFVASQVADLTAFVGQQLGLRFHGVTKAGKGDSQGLYLDDVDVIEPNLNEAAPSRPQF